MWSSCRIMISGCVCYSDDVCKTRNSRETGVALAHCRRSRVITVEEMKEQAPQTAGCITPTTRKRESMLTYPAHSFHTCCPDPQQQMVLMLIVGKVGEGVRCSLKLELTDAYEPLCGARNRILVNWKSGQFSQPLSHFLVPFRNLFKGTIYMKSNCYLKASIICLIKDFLFSVVNAWILFIRCMYTPLEA